MFCAFEGPPLILRLYGTGRALALGSSEFGAHAPAFTLLPGTRQIVELQVDLVQTSCGFGVPLLDFREDRAALTRQAEAWGEEGLRDYWEREPAERRRLSHGPAGQAGRSGRPGSGPECIA